MSRRAGAAIEISAALLIGAAVAVTYASPHRIELFVTTLGSRGATRALIAAALLLGLRAWLARGPAVLTMWLGAAARVGAGALMVAGTLGWATYLSTTCGGADSYGYVSASQRILAGRLIDEEPLASILPFPDAIAAALPLGYAASPRIANASVPVYPLGLPALMAAATLIGGPTAPFAVAPVMGLVLLAAVYATARAWYADRLIALLAAALVAVHPVAFTYSIQPMSDVPAAAMFIVAVALLSRRRPRPLLAGVAAAVALLVRPVLAPALGTLVVIPLLTAEATSGWPRTRWRRAAAFVGPLAVGAALQALSQMYLFGSPLAIGYGAAGNLFSIDRAGMNLRSYAYWTFMAIGPVLLGAAAVGAAWTPRVARLLLVVASGAVLLPYVVYQHYDHWETLRFLLPALILLTIAAAAGLVWVCRRVAGAAGSIAAVAVAFAIAFSWMEWLAGNNVFTMPEHEARHRLAGEMVARATPPSAVVLALQHSGSLRYYAGRHTANWHRIPPGALADTVVALQQQGLAVFVMIDSEAERAMFAERHGDALAGWLPAGQRREVQLYEAPTGIGDRGSGIKNQREP